MVRWAWGAKHAEVIQKLDREIGQYRQRGPFGVTWGGPGAETWPFAVNWQKGLDTSSNRLSMPYAQHANIANAISILAEDMASVPWAVFSKEHEAVTPFSVFGDFSQDSPVPHPLMDVWAKPNPWMNGIQLFIGTYVSFWVFGEAFWYYPNLEMPRDIPSSAQRLVNRLSTNRLDLIDPRAVITKADGDGVRWFQRVAGKDIPLNPERLTQFKRWNPYGELGGPLRGLSKITALVAEIEGDQAAADWNRRFFGEQNGIPSGLLIPSQGSDPLNEQQEKLVLTKFNVRHGTARTVGLLPAGWDWKDVGVKQRDMEFPRLRDYSREQVYGLLQVPPFRAGVLDKANYANARQQDQVYWNGVIRRTLAYFKGVLDHDFLPKLGVRDVCICPQWDLIRQMLEDFHGKAQTAETLRGLGVPLTLINAKLNLGFDLTGVPGADEPFMLQNYVPVRQLLEAPVTSPADAEGAGDTGPNDDEESDQLAAQFAMAGLVKSLERRLRSHIHTIQKISTANIDRQDEPLFDRKEADLHLKRSVADVFYRAVKQVARINDFDADPRSPALSALCASCILMLCKINADLDARLHSDGRIASRDSSMDDERTAALRMEVGNVCTEFKAHCKAIATAAMQDVFDRTAILIKRLSA